MIKLENMPSKTTHSVVGQNRGNAVTADNGATATISNIQDKQSFRVFSKDRELVFEYDVETGKSRLFLPSGDLEVVASAGNLDFTAAESIRFRGESIELESRAGIRMSIRNAVGQIVSSFRMRGSQQSINCSDINVQSDRGVIEIEDLQQAGEKLTLKYERIQMMADWTESIARIAILKAADCYRTITGLSELKAGRVKTKVESAYHLKCEKAMMKSDADFKIKGEQIHLG